MKLRIWVRMSDLASGYCKILYEGFSTILSKGVLSVSYNLSVLADCTKGSRCQVSKPPG